MLKPHFFKAGRGMPCLGEGVALGVLDFQLVNEAEAP